MVNVLATEQNLANDYSALGAWIGLCTGVPGNTNVVANEIVGGTPAYGRQETTWTAGTNGTASGTPVTINVPPGTYPYMIVCQSSAGSTMVDWCLLSTPIEVTQQAAVKVTPSIVLQ